MEKGKPSLVTIARNAIIFLAVNNKYITHKKARESLTEGINSQYSRSTFDEAWKYLLGKDIIVPIPKDDPEWKECENETYKIRKFYRFNHEKAPDVYSSLNWSVEKVNTPDKAFMYIDRISVLYQKLDECAYYEDLISKILAKVKNINHSDENFLLNFHYRLLCGVNLVQDWWSTKYDAEFLHLIHEEITQFSSQVRNGACNDVSALGITATAFSIIWRSNRVMGRNEFSRVVGEAITSLKGLEISGDSTEVKRNFRILQCYLNNALNYAGYFSESERNQFLISMQESYFSANLPNDFNLKSLMDSVINRLL